MNDIKIFKNYHEDDVLAKILLLYFAFQHGAIGIFFISMTKDDVTREYFRVMSEILPLNIWGIILLVSAIFFMIAIIQEYKIAYISMVVGGLLGHVTFSLLAMASIELSQYQTNTVNYIIIASVDMIVAILGGVAIWLRRNT